MAPPQLVSLENYSDVQFRDVVHRRSQLVAPTANVIQKLYHHTDGSTVRLSGAELLTTDAGGNVQYALMLGSNTQFLDGNTLTAANVSTWSTSSVFTANNSHFTVRAPTFTANAISCQKLNLSNDVSFANVTATNMMVTGNITVDTSTLTVDPTNNRVGIVQTTPTYPLDVTGDVNSTGVLRIGGTEVLSGTTLGSEIITSSLTTVGTLGNLTTNTAGTATLGSTVIRSFQKTLATASGNVTEICTITGSNLTFAGHLYVVQAATGKACLAYTLCVSAQNGSGGTTNGNWQRLVPISSISGPALFGVAVEINVNTAVNGECKIRLARTTNAGTSADIECVLVLQQSRATPITITNSDITASNQTLATDLFKGTVLTQVSGNVGIGTDSPTNLLTVAGTANVQSLIVTGDAGLSGNVAVGNLSSNAITATWATLSGNLTVNNATSNAITTKEFTASTGNVRIQQMTDISVYSWTSQTSAGDYAWNGITYGEGVYVAVGNVAVSATGNNQVMYSANASSWTLSTNAGGYRQNWTSVTYGDGLFVAVASTNLNGDNKQVLRSLDGISWGQQTTPNPLTTNEYQSVAYGKGTFVAVASAGQAGQRVMSSSDKAITWSLQSSASDNEWRSVTYGNDLFVAVASSGTGNRVMTSPDGTTWTSRTSASDNDWWGVTFGNNIFVAVARSGVGNRVMTSPDGVTWTSRTSAADLEWSSVTYGSGFFSAVAQTGVGTRVMTSRDGITWTLRNSAQDNSWQAVTYGEGQFVAVSTSGVGDRVMTWSPSLTVGEESGIMYYNSTTGLVSYSAFVDSLNGRFRRLEATETLSAPEISISGDLTVPGNLTANSVTLTNISAATLSLTGSADFDGISTRRFLKTLGGTIGDTSEICQVDSYYGVFAAEIVIISDNSLSSSGRFSKTYHVNVRDDATGGAYQLLLPSTTDTHAGVAVEMLTTSGINSTTTFRLHRITTLSGGNDIECHIKVYYSTRQTDVEIVDMTGTLSGQTLATTIYETSSITNVNGNVGIGTSNPTSKLTVAGTANVTAIVSTDVKTGNATFFTQSGYGSLNFSDKWRLYYNQVDDQLEIQKNTAGTWSTTAVLAT